jgi:hypothetical protein
MVLAVPVDVPVGIFWSEGIMSDTGRIITPERYAQGFTYERYLDITGANREKFQDNDATFQLSAIDSHFFQDTLRRVGPLRVLAIAEDWSPDVHRYLPVMARIAEAAGIELRVFQRDKNPDIMNLYLNQGKFMSIPVFAFFDRDFACLCHWIERPAVASRFVESLNTELTPRNLSTEELRAERRKRSATFICEWQRETLGELKQLMCRIGEKV